MVCVALLVFGKISSRDIYNVLCRLNVECRVVLPGETPDFNFTHIIISGGPHSVYQESFTILPSWIVDSTCPVLGICYGAQLIAAHFGSVIKRMDELKKGCFDIIEFRGDKQVTISRYINCIDEISYLSDNFTVTGVTNDNKIASFTDEKRFWGVQYRPESTRSKDSKIFKRFLKI